MTKSTYLKAGLFLLLLATIGGAQARFVSVDPVQANADNGQNFNRYYYGNNNPYKFTDPDGRQSREFNWENQNVHKITPPPRSDKDWLGPAIGYSLGGMLAAPVAGFAVTNPATATAVGNGLADIAMGDALGGASLAAGGTALFRVVDNVELSSIKDVGRFLPSPNGDSVKRFLNNLPDAKALAQKFSGKFGEQHVVQGIAPQKVIDASSITPFSDVPGRSMNSIGVPNEQLPNIKCVGRVDGC